MGTRIKGVFEAAHGVGENLRGRMLGAIDDVTHTASEKSRSHHTSLADRGRTEAETGIAHMYGYADPNVYRDELSRMQKSAAGTSGRANGTAPGRGSMREDGYYGHDGRVDDTKGLGGYETGQPGAQGFGQQQPQIDRNRPVTNERGGDPPNNAPQNNSERMKRDFAAELPPQPQAQAAGDGQHGQLYQ